MLLEWFCILTIHKLCILIIVSVIGSVVLKRKILKAISTSKIKFHQNMPQLQSIRNGKFGKGPFMALNHLLPKDILFYKFG